MGAGHDNSLLRMTTTHVDLIHYIPHSLVKFTKKQTRPKRLLVFVGLLIGLQLYFFVQNQEFTLPSQDDVPANRRRILSTATFHETSVGLDALEGHVAAFGDFNSDKATDLFVVSSDKSSVVVYAWDSDEFRFHKLPDTSVELSGVNSTIAGVAPGDFTYDGQMDLLLYGPVDRGASDDGSIPFFLQLYQGTSPSSLDTLHPVHLPASLGEPLLLDADGDLLLDILGVAYETSALSLWKNNGDGSHFTVSPFLETEDHPPTPTNVHSHTFIDLDGDCLADLAITGREVRCQGHECSTLDSVQVWLNTRSGFVWMKDKSFHLAQGAGQTTWFDVDGDGSADLVYPVCYPRGTCSQSNELHIRFNRQRKMCESMWAVDTSTCRPQTALCRSDSEFKIGKTKDEDDVIAQLPRGYRLADDVEGFPLTVRAGDYDSDGYPDLLVPVVDSAGVHRAILLKSVEHSIDGNRRRRTFELEEGGTSALMSLKHVQAATFFDLDENGALDIIVLAEREGKPGVFALYNHINMDAFFLKALGLNGVCPAWCSTGQRFPHPKPYGVNQPGVTFKITVTDLNGHKSVRHGSQLSRSSHFALQTPYVLFGLGRTNNYVEEFFMGMTLTESKHWNKWISIIPNSQLIAFPYEPTSPSDWILELYVSPSSKLLWVIMALGVTCAVLGLLIIFFSWRERREDEKEKQESAHLFSFSAL